MLDGEKFLFQQRLDLAAPTFQVGQWPQARGRSIRRENTPSSSSKSSSSNNNMSQSMSRDVLKEIKAGVEGAMAQPSYVHLYRVPRQGWPDGWTDGCVDQILG